MYICYFEQHKKSKNLKQKKFTGYFVTPQSPRAGVDNSFGFTGPCRDELGIPGPVHVHITDFKAVL